MKKNILISLSLTIVFIASITFIISNQNNDFKGKYEPRKKKAKQHFRRGIKGAIEYLSWVKNNRETGTIDKEDVYKALRQINSMPKLKDNDDTEWIEMGPDNIGGRTRALLIDKTDPTFKTLYAAGVSGGLWKSNTLGSSWSKESIKQANNDVIVPFANHPISSIAQDTNGVIYIGTGEGLGTSTSGAAASTTGFIGDGIYKLVKDNDFDLVSHLTNTKSFNYVNKLAVNPKNNYLYAATNGGLKVSTNGGETWTTKIAGSNSTDIKISVDGEILVASVDNKYHLSLDGGNTFENRAGKNGFPAASLISRVEFDISKSNTNYIYAAAANSIGKTLGVYRSTDKGVNWTQIGPGNSESFQIYGEGLTGQGTYDNVITIFPTDPNRILVGGVTLYEWKEGKTWVNKTNGVNYPIHADIHAIIFHPKNPKMYFVSTDGGIHRTSDEGLTYETINFNFNVTQFYAMNFSGNDEVMGGTQDNGTIYINRQFHSDRGGYDITGGDAGWCSFSLINPGATFATLYYSGAYRNPDKKTLYAVQSPAEWFSGAFHGLNNNKNWGMLGEGTEERDGKPTKFPAPFVTPLLLWETFNDAFSKDYTKFTADKAYNKNDVVVVRSKNNSFPFYYTLPKNLAKDSSINVIDKVQSRFFLGWDTEIWMTKGAIEFTGTPKWFKIANVDWGTKCLAISKDGNHLFAGTLTGNLYRISNIRFAYDSITSYLGSKYSLLNVSLIKSFPGRAVTSISVDPQNSSHIVVTLGNYGGTDYIYQSNNALDASPAFLSKQGNPNSGGLPQMPVYSSVIEMDNPNTIYVGTEFGIFKTSNIQASKPTWVEVNKGMDKVGTFWLGQQIFKYDGDFAPTGNPAEPFADIKNNSYNYAKYNVTNYGVIYAATHGRGIFKTEKYKKILSIKDVVAKNNQESLNIFPNPASDVININYNISSPSKININIYDMNGRLVKNETFNKTSTGHQVFTINVNNLSKGTYFINLISNSGSSAGKFLITK